MPIWVLIETQTHLVVHSFDPLLLPCLFALSTHVVVVLFAQVKIWFQNRRMKWRNSKERELLSNGGTREQTLPTKNNPNPGNIELIGIFAGI